MIVGVASIVIILGFPRLTFMLLLSAILRVWAPREVEPNDLLAETRARVGHLGLTIIALVFILISLWQH